MPSDILIPQSSTSQIRHFMLRSSTTGQGLTGKVASDFSGKYNVNGGAEVTLSFSAGSAGDSFSSGKICELGLGKYAWHVPDTLFGTAGSVSAVLSCSDAIDVHFDWTVAAVNRAVARFGASDGTNVTLAASQPNYAPATAADVYDQVESWASSNDLFVKIADLPTVAEFEARTLAAASYATASQISSLQVNTRANVMVPVEIETPDSGTQTWKIRLFLFDEEGNMEAPDSTPTITLTNAAGTDRSSRLSSATVLSTGAYSWDYTSTAGDTEEQLNWTFTVIEGGLTRIYPATSYVVEETAYRFTSTDRATLNATATQSSLNTVASNVAAIKTKTDSMPDQSLVIISDGTNGREVKVTAAKHIAADVHTLQQEALAQFATDDTGETSAAAGSVALLSQGGSSGTGTGARTVTITVNDGTAALQNARVRLTEGANTFTSLTNASGVVTFNLDDATYTVGITKSGYSYAGTTLVVDGDEVVTYSMSVVSVTPPSSPDKSVLTILCLDSEGDAASGVNISIRYTAVPEGSEDIAFPGGSITKASNGSGIASFEVIKGATIEYKRGTRDVWAEAVMSDEDTTSITSFIGTP